jgi:hypothetical protein
MATANVTVPLPVPLAPAVMTIQFALLEAVQAQPGPLVTLTVPVLAVAGTVWLGGEMEYAHDAAGAD